MPLQLVTSESRHSFELYGLGLCVAFGFPLIFGNATPGSIAATLSPLQQDIWGVMLCLGATIAIVGIAWKDRVTGIILEQIGLMAVGCSTILYALVILYATGSSGYLSAGIIGSFGLACISRWRRLGKALKRAGRKARQRGGS